MFIYTFFYKIHRNQFITWLFLSQSTSFFTWVFYVFPSNFVIVFNPLICIVICFCREPIEVRCTLMWTRMPFSASRISLFSYTLNMYIGDRMLKHVCIFGAPGDNFRLIRVYTFSMPFSYCWLHTQTQHRYLKPLRLWQELVSHA